jgi:hypothetical protein
LSKAAFVRQRDRLTAKIVQIREAEPDDGPELPLEIARNLDKFWDISGRRAVPRWVLTRLLDEQRERENGWRWRRRSERHG